MISKDFTLAVTDRRDVIPAALSRFEEPVTEQIRGSD